MDSCLSQGHVKMTVNCINPLSLKTVGDVGECVVANVLHYNIIVSEFELDLALLRSFFGVIPLGKV